MRSALDGVALHGEDDRVGVTADGDVSIRLSCAGTVTVRVPSPDRMDGVQTPDGSTLVRRFRGAHLLGTTDSGNTDTDMAGADPGTGRNDMGDTGAPSVARDHWHPVSRTLLLTPGAARDEVTRVAFRRT